MMRHGNSIGNTNIVIIDITHAGGRDSNNGGAETSGDNTAAANAAPAPVHAAALKGAAFRFVLGGGGVVPVVFGS